MVEQAAHNRSVVGSSPTGSTLTRGQQMKVGDCWECNATSVEIHHHHPVPRSRGGTKTVPLCLECHAKAHHRKKRMASSILTKEGLARAKKRGVALGNPKITEVGEKGRNTQKKQAVAYANKIEPMLRNLRKQGMSFASIAKTFNETGISTRRGGKWHASTVRNYFNKLERSA